MNAYIVLLSHSPNGTAKLANQAEFYGACQHDSDNYVVIQKIFVLWSWLSKKTNIHIFLETCFESTFLSQNLQSAAIGAPDLKISNET